ncbi:unnamed protein product [Adineta steineri]|uniref:Uncharacterized protein n=1 Tax=Adineta steineri TaxID=433720 RepID=A0A819FRS8_9BILA|nr:unnamed protein product [Adineta steineri]CAF0781327.1 unnamed protein product [Adineta steineri]CAF0828712.1 unnamed protein product [Adineta steineri]CAF3870541.1 unnamed protein product [Adineta steineri]CAF3922747.1 unnamed protein product [Adineta steineri]
MNFQVSSEDEIVVFPHGEAGYNCTRIPSILTTSAGTLLAFGEARMFTCHDNIQIDIVYKRSLDNGKTWSSLQVLYRGNSSGENYNWVGNFAPVQLKYNQRILVPFCKNNLIVMQTYSDDDGLIFSQPQIILNVTKPNWKWVALGPPGGLLLQSNRILIPGDYSTNSNVISGSSSTGFVMLNDFNGQIDKCNNGGITFNKVKVLNTLVQPLHGCEGSTIYHKNTGQLFYTGLAEISTTRANLSLHMSHDNGEHWTYIKTICPDSSGYSSMTILNDQSIGLLYEKGSIMGGPASLTFTIIYNQTTWNIL